MEIIFHSPANKTHFQKKGCALGLVLKVRVFGTRKWPIKAPGGLYLEFALKYKINQSKNGTVTHKFLHLPENYYVCKMIAVKKFHSISLFA